MFGLINWFIPAAESTSQQSVFPKSSALVVKWFQMSGRVMYGIIPWVLLACAHHPKLDDLNSISCLLSMRLHRHANNRKFALKGVDQQPLTLNHDSEVSHDSSACYRPKGAPFLYFYTPMKTKVSLGLSCESEFGCRWKPRSPVGFWKKTHQQILTWLSNTHLTPVQSFVATEHSLRRISLWGLTSWPVFRNRAEMFPSIRTVK